MASLGCVLLAVPVGLASLLLQNLLIGTQQRDDLFALAARKPEPLYEAAVEVPGRLGADAVIPSEDDVPGRVRDLNGGRGVDRVLLCTAATSAFDQAFPQISDGSRGCRVESGRVVTRVAVVFVVGGPLFSGRQVEEVGQRTPGVSVFLT